MSVSLSKKIAASVIVMALAILISPANAQTLIFSQAIGGYKYNCHTDANKNPYSDCLNSIAKICNTTDSWSSAKKTNCQTGVNTVYGGLNSWWQAVRKECGQWPITLNGKSYTGVYPSDNCNSANINLIKNAFYTRLDGSKVKIDSTFTNYQNAGLWSKVTA
jgi:hypothetical protein